MRRLEGTLEEEKIFGKVLGTVVADIRPPRR